MSIDSMGSLPPKANEPANTAQTDGTTGSNMMDISPEKQDEPVAEIDVVANESALNSSSNGHAPVAMATDLPTANETSEARGSKVPLTDESIEPDELRPAKKQKQDDSPMDVSTDTHTENGATSAPNKDGGELVPAAPVCSNTGTAPDSGAPEESPSAAPDNTDHATSAEDLGTAPDSAAPDTTPDTAPNESTGAASRSTDPDSTAPDTAPGTDTAPKSNDPDSTAPETAPETAPGKDTAGTAPDSATVTGSVPATSTNETEDKSSVIHPDIAAIIKLEDIPAVEPLECLTIRDMAELESSLQIGDTYSYNDDDGWKPDWGGNLLLYEKDVIVNRGYLANQPNAKPVRIKYCDWVASNAQGGTGLRGLELLLRFVYNMKGTPSMAKKVLAYALQRPAESSEQRLNFIVDATQRVSYDPVVLQEDGWTIRKVDTPEEGEAFHIGRRIMWQRHEAIVIAWTPDETYGGLWKAAYVEDLETFDLEPGELSQGIKRWENKQKQLHKKKNARPVPPSGSTRFAATANFTIEGIENGIILAMTPQQRGQGVLWPARVRHVVEGELTLQGNVRRNSSKNMIQVVFLAPFWNGGQSSSSNNKDPYSQGPLFEFETIEVSEYNIRKYPFDELSIEKVQNSFRFLGLPKAVFPRYLDSHRLAVALKTYAIKHISSDHATRSEDQIYASASLTESHGLSVRAPIFPSVALHVPFDFILSKLPHPTEQLASSVASGDDGDSDTFEPTIDINAVIHSMSPPECFGKKHPSTEQGNNSLLTPEYNKNLILSPDPTFTPAIKVVSQAENEEELWAINKFASDFLCGLFQQSSGDDLAIDGLGYMHKLLASLISKLRRISDSFSGYSASKQKFELKNILCQILTIKGHGEDSIECGTIPPGVSKATIVIEWRKACERLYKRAVGKLSSPGIGNNITSVVTDTRCNGHITQAGSFERPVRLPAAIKGAKSAGAGTDPNVLLITEIEDSYLSTAENDIIPKAHKQTYIKRLKARVASIPLDETGAPLTEDSEGEGGEDTMGSRGSYTAAVVGVAASIKAADMVVGGQCVNAFCAVRPPGHHAGQELRSMKAISNGFCLFNAAACAALYATTPLSQGGLGLRRVCVIDFDVHHGNGTQDILCSTYDPRFLYVSVHAGGAHINGYDDEDSDEESFRLRLGGKKQQGIFPGRCGDTNPHSGVLNIPLGQRVTASSVGAAFMSQVTPRVEAFSPDLIILSAGFDAHVNDPLGMGGLTAEDFKSLTEVSCQMAYKTCSGRILSLLEGGYGVPCCQPRDDLFLPKNPDEKFLNLGSDLPADMKDEVPFTLRQKLDRCHAEGFIECVKEHVSGFVKCNKRK